MMNHLLRTIRDILRPRYHTLAYRDHCLMPEVVIKHRFKSEAITDARGLRNEGFRARNIHVTDRETLASIEWRK